MKVVLKPVMFEKIKKAVEEHGDSIVRIELTGYEFDILMKEIEDHKIDVFFDCIEAIVNGHWSGSYVVYKGVCIQTHESYTE